MLFRTPHSSNRLFLVVLLLASFSAILLDAQRNNGGGNGGGGGQTPTTTNSNGNGNSTNSNNSSNSASSSQPSSSSSSSSSSCVTNANSTDTACQDTSNVRVCNGTGSLGVFIFTSPTLLTSAFVNQQLNVSWTFSSSTYVRPSQNITLFYASVFSLGNNPANPWTQITGLSIPPSATNAMWTPPKVSDGYFKLRIVGDGVGSATDTCAPDGFPAPGVSVQFQIHNQGAVVGTKDNFAPNSSAIKDSAGEEMEVAWLTKPAAAAADGSATSGADAGGKENNKKQAVAASPVDKKRRTEKNDDIVETVSSSSSPLKSPSKSSTLSSSVAAAVAASPRKSTTTAATAAAKPFTSNPSSSSPSSSTDNAPTKDDLLQNGMWAEGKQVPYSALCAVFEKIEATSKRLEITELLVQFFRQVILRSPECMVMAVYLCLNKVGPDYDGKELGIGESLLMKAIERSTGLTLADVKREATKKGDLGQVAQDCAKSQSRIDSGGYFKKISTSTAATKLLTISTVFKTLQEITNISGTKSQSEKIGKIFKILQQCGNQEPKYFIRSLEGKLRIGLAERTVLSAIARAVALTDPETKDFKGEKLERALSEADETLKSVYSELPCYDLIIPALLSSGIKDLSSVCKLTPGIPLKPMLAHPTKALTEVLDRFEGQAFTCEYKYDGERAQIHQFNKDGQKTIMVFSRNSENLSGKYPDIPIQMAGVVGEGVESFVLDCEAVAWDRVKKCILPFQQLQTRKRKDVAAEDVSVCVCIYAFDLLYFNGEAVTRKSLKERREILMNNFIEREGEFTFAKHINSASIEDIQTFLDESITGNCEGLMVKTLDTDATYEPSKRSRNWLKVKKDYLEGIGDTLDLVVLGAYFGRGKRTGVYGGYLLGCYDEDTEDFQSICKLGTGFSDEDLVKLTESLKPHVVAKPPSSYAFSDTPNISPDVWFEPKQVWEIKAADLSLSPVHKAGIGLVDDSRGISLRFPRFIRVREDKGVIDATNSVQVKTMYLSQQSVSSSSKSAGAAADDDFDF